MWPATLDTIRIVRPKIAFLENVPGLLNSGYFGTILSDLAEIGYDAKWTCLSAAQLGARQIRERLWLLAYIDNKRLSKFKSQRKEQQGRIRLNWFPLRYQWSEIDSAEAYLGRGVPGIPHRVDRIKALGNGQVPAVAATAFRLLGDLYERN